VVDGPVRADMARVKARKDAISGQSRAGLEESLKTLENCTIYRGHARFVSPHEVQVGEALLTAERIFINVGGRAVVPTWPGLEPHESLFQLHGCSFRPRNKGARRPFEGQFASVVRMATGLPEDYRFSIPIMVFSEAKPRPVRAPVSSLH
jgi:hypothetical protein